MGKVYIGNEEVSPLLVRGGTTDGLTKAQADKLYVGKTDANNTYLKKTDASNTYLKKTDADNTYSKKTDADNTYLKKSEADNKLLPSQAGKSGKFLSTNGSTAVWVDAPSGGGSGGSIIGPSGGVAIGDNADATPQGCAVGNNAYASDYATAIGQDAKATAMDAIQIGWGTNPDGATLKVGLYPANYTLMTSDGLIPSERLALNGETGQVLTKTSAGMEWQDASGAAAGDYLPLSGGTLNGALGINVGKASSSYEPLLAAYIEGETTNGTTNRRSIYYSPDGNLLKFEMPLSANNIMPNGTHNLGNSASLWNKVYATKLNNGADIAIPTEGGTLARIEDIDAAVGDISAALAVILGE